VNVAVVVPELPSVTLTSLIVSTGGGSSSVIVPVPCPSTMVAFDAFVRLTRKVSFASSSVSLLTTTVTVFVVSPAAKVSVPVPAA
jgi:hypothetical protein